MALKFSTGLRNELATLGSLKSRLDGCVIRIYSGAVPASADAPLSGAVLQCEISNGGTPVTFAAGPQAGSIIKSPEETWSGVNAASGTVSFFRIVKPADDGASSTSAVRVQGTSGGPAEDMFISNPALSIGAPQLIDYLVLTVAESA